MLLNYYVYKTTSLDGLYNKKDFALNHTIIHIKEGLIKID